MVCMQMHCYKIIYPFNCNKPVGRVVFSINTAILGFIPSSKTIVTV